MSAPLLLMMTAMFGASPELEEGRVAFARLKYQQAVDVLRPLTLKTDAPAEERAEAFELIARASLALGNTSQAVAAFDGYLQLKPMAEEPQGSPKVRAAFLEAKKARFPPGFVELLRRPSGNEVLELDVVNPWRVPLTLELWEATTGDFVKRELAVQQNRALTALAPGSRAYVKAVGADGRTLAALGSAVAPIEGPPAPVVVTRPTDAPKVEPTLAPTERLPLPPAPELKSGGERRVGGWVSLGVGAVLIAVSVGLLAWGSSDKGCAAYFPFCASSLTEVSSLESSGNTKMLVGGIGLGLGGLTALTGAGLLLFGN
jgi:hypothetical protein